jgi:hypothetical protein
LHTTSFDFRLSFIVKYYWCIFDLFSCAKRRKKMQLQCCYIILHSQMTNSLCLNIEPETYKYLYTYILSDKIWFFTSTAIQFWFLSYIFLLKKLLTTSKQFWFSCYYFYYVWISLKVTITLSVKRAFLNYPFGYRFFSFVKNYSLHHSTRIHTHTLSLSVRVCVI